MAPLFTRIFSLVFVALGVCGFIPMFVDPHLPISDPVHNRVLFHGGLLFGVFPTNYVLAALFLALGIWGLIASMWVQRSRVFDRVIFALSLLFMLLGFMPDGISTLWGLLPLFGFNIAFFFMTGMYIFYFAFVEGPPMQGTDFPIYTP